MSICYFNRVSSLQIEYVEHVTRIAQLNPFTRWHIDTASSSSSLFYVQGLRESNPPGSAWFHTLPHIGLRFHFGGTSLQHTR